MVGSNAVPDEIRPAVRRLATLALRLATAGIVPGLLWRQMGPAPFVAGLRAATWQSVAVAVVLTALTTPCSATRWRVIARALDLGQVNGRRPVITDGSSDCQPM